MQYNFTNIGLAEDVNGQPYVKTTAVKAGDPNDRGFQLPFFNPQVITAVQKAINEGETPTFSFDAEIEEETVNLGAVYFRRQTDTNGKPTENYAINSKTGKPDPVRKLRVHTIFQYSMHDAYYTSGEKKGMRIMENIYVNGVLTTVPARQYDLDDLGRPIRNYMNGWTKEERRDRVLDVFFKLAPQEYQAVTAAPTPEVTQASAQQTLQGAVNGMFGTQPQQGTAAPQPEVTQQTGIQQGANATVDPLALRV